MSDHEVSVPGSNGDSQATKAVGYAFSAGYYHLDGAAVYGEL